MAFTSTGTSIWYNAVQAWSSIGLPLAWLNVAVLVAPLAIFLGIGQGTVLSVVYRRNIVGFWVLTNVFAALVVGIVILAMTSFDGVLTLFSGGALYGLVTGPALFVLASRDGGVETSPPMSYRSFVGA